MLAALALLVTILSPIAPSLAANDTKEDRIPEDAVQVELDRIVDGDTFDAFILENGRTEDERIRMIGIDTPETNYSYGNEPECYGSEATKKTESILVAAKEIWVEQDVSDRDKNGRLLRYVWYVSHVDGKVYLLNEELVKLGYALAKTYRPDTKYQDRLDAAEETAIRNSAGMWMACDASVSGDPSEETDGEPDSEPIDRTKTPESDLPEDAACSFFDTYDEAQEWLAVFPELAESIDLDNDGYACEDYFGVNPEA
jgi:endonuclease YncB( thermonuclease family)